MWLLRVGHKRDTAPTQLSPLDRSPWELPHCVEGLAARSSLCGRSRAQPQTRD